MHKGEKIAGLGLLRLLAGHIVLRHQISVFFWDASTLTETKLLEPLRKDYKGLDRLIDNLGETTAAMDAHPQWALQELVKQSSVDPTTECLGMSERVRTLRTSHQQIIEDIGTLEVLIPLEQSPQVARLLVRLRARHAKWRTALEGPHRLH